MRRSLPLAERLRVREPCSTSWDQVHGDERSRFCSACNKQVHNVAALTRAEAEALVLTRRPGERICLHVHVRKSDGAILLADGYAIPTRPRARRGLAVVATAGATALAACAGQEHLA